MKEPELKQFRDLALGYIYPQKLFPAKGKVWVESELGNGSTFYFELPNV